LNDSGRNRLVMVEDKRFGDILDSGEMNAPKFSPSIDMIE
jgi:hypothetical protein